MRHKRKPSKSETLRARRASKEPTAEHLAKQSFVSMRSSPTAPTLTVTVTYEGATVRVLTVDRDIHARALVKTYHKIAAKMKGEGFGTREVQIEQMKAELMEGVRCGVDTGDWGAVLGCTCFIWIALAGPDTAEIHLAGLEWLAFDLFKDRDPMVREKAVAV